MSLSSSKNTASPLSVHLALAAVSLIYGFFYVAVKLLLQEISEMQLIFLRFALTGVIVAALEWGYFKSRFASWADFFKIAGLGILGVLLVQNLVIMGIHRTTSFHAALIMATIPLMTLLWGMLLRREPVLPQKIIGILVAFGGVAMLLVNKHPDTPLPDTYLLGDFIILLNSLGFSWFLIGSQRMLKRYSSFSFMAYGYIVSAIINSAVFVGFIEPSFGFLAALSVTGWILVAYIVLFASIGTYTLNNYALSRISPSIVAVYIFTQPVLSAIFGYYVLGEPFNLNMAMAAGVTFGGMILATRASQQTSQQASRPVDE